jgi:hypothetical protein
MIAPGEGYVLVVRFYINGYCLQMLWRRRLHFPLLTTLFPPAPPGPSKSMIAMVFLERVKSPGEGGQLSLPHSSAIFTPPPKAWDPQLGRAQAAHVSSRSPALKWSAALKNGRAARARWLPVRSLPALLTRQVIDKGGPAKRRAAVGP